MKIQNISLAQTSFSAQPKESSLNPAKISAQDIEQLFSNLAKDSKEKHENSSLVQWFKDFSKVIFSQESTYRGLLEFFTDDLPSIVDAFRGKAALLESMFQSVCSTGLMLTAPLVAKAFARFYSRQIFESDLASQVDTLMLFQRQDLDSNENFNNAKSRIINDELQEQMTMFDFKRAKGLEGTVKRVSALFEFMENQKTTPDLREKILKLKDHVIKAHSWFESITWSAIPLAQRIFRKYVLGLDRFSGSVKYLTDIQAKDLGNEKGFSIKQVLGTIFSSISSPLLVSLGLEKINETKSNKSSFLEFIKKQLDTEHSYFPKLGLFVFQGELPCFISKIFNSQDKFELVENVIKVLTNNLSTFFGDRLTNGNFARAYDKKLVEEFNVEPGILYQKSESILASLFPEANKFTEVLNKTKKNPELKKKANDFFEQAFYKGFGLHVGLMFVARFLINGITKLRVKNALGNNV